MVSVRDAIREIQREVRDEQLLPERASALLAKLTALYGNVLDEMRAADMGYAEVLLQCLEGDEAANRATIRAETTSAYARKREARDMEKLTVELIRSLKVFVKAQQEEMRLSR